MLFKEQLLTLSEFRELVLYDFTWVFSKAQFIMAVGFFCVETSCRRSPSPQAPVAFYQCFPQVFLFSKLGAQGKLHE